MRWRQRRTAAEGEARASVSGTERGDMGEYEGRTGSTADNEYVDHVRHDRLFSPVSSTSMGQNPVRPGRTSLQDETRPAPPSVDPFQARVLCSEVIEVLVRLAELDVIFHL